MSLPYQCRAASMLEWKQPAAGGLAGLAAFKCIPGTETCIELCRRERTGYMQVHPRNQ